MLTTNRLPREILVCAMLLIAAATTGCRGDLLGVVSPPNAIAASQLHDSTDAEALRAGAIGAFSSGVGATQGMLRYNGMMADEFYTSVALVMEVAADTRTVQPSSGTAMDGTYIEIQRARIQSLQAVQALEQNTSTAGSGDVGEVFAVAGYAELLLAETMCSGIPLTQISLSSTVTAGEPLATDSVLAVAVAHFDSAAAHAAGQALVANLAAVGRGRALLDLGRPADAGAAVASVTPSFLYTVTLPGTQVDIYHNMFSQFSIANVADVKGRNGLPFVSAHDARLPTLAGGQSAIATTTVSPLKFASTATSNGPIPLADGVEGGLIIAEAALAAGDTSGWLAALNTLRMNFVVLRGP
jgi:hypothetical protein